jgi:16S rRNA (cytosine967-C5)-methyltransferase
MDAPVVVTSTQPSPWSLAVVLLDRWIESHVRVDVLLEDLPRSLMGAERGRCQSLLFGAIRHRGRLTQHLYTLVARAPRSRLQAILLVAGFELIEGGDEHHVARVVHHAVEQAKTLTSEPEAKMVNAVVRKLAAALAAESVPPKLAGSAPLSNYFSHPEWLVQRWLAQFGAASTRRLLEWNQSPAPVYARWRGTVFTGETPAWLKPTSWPTFFEIVHGHWPEVEKALREGLIYLQDPSTRLAVDLLAPQSGETLLDACAAPGGKCLAMADRMLSGGVVAMDLPGERIARLEENHGRITTVDTHLLQADVARVRPDDFRAAGLPTEYAGVLLDVPCSNTGVMRHRVDVRWRLMPNDIPKHARQQGAIVWAASRWVAPGGRLVYSTCSLDAEENAEVVADFVERSRGRFSLERSIVSYPWESGHDGAGVFLLRRAER